MYTQDHFLVSIGVGVAIVVLSPTASPIVTIIVAAVAGTAIDLDHFLVARYQSGSWAAVRRGLTDPRRLITRQSELFEYGEVGVLYRLLTHTIITGLVVFAGWFLVPELTLIIGVSLYFHILTDLIADITRVDGVVVHASEYK